MNPTQKYAVLAGIIVVALMGLIPPWNYVYKDQVKPAGYAWLFNPTYQDTTSFLSKLLAPKEELKKPLFKILDQPPWTPKIDASRLMIQWMVAVALTGGLVLVLKKKS